MKEKFPGNSRGKEGGRTLGSYSLSTEGGVGSPHFRTYTSRVQPSVCKVWPAAETAMIALLSFAPFGRSALATVHFAAGSIGRMDNTRSGTLRGVY